MSGFLSGLLASVVTKVLGSLVDRVQQWMLERRAKALEARVRQLEAKVKAMEAAEAAEEKIVDAVRKKQQLQQERNTVEKKRLALQEFVNKHKGA